MKISIFLLIVGLMNVSAGVYSQEAKITLDLKNATFEEVLWEIQKQTEFIFLYSADDVKKIDNINLSFKEASINAILTECLANSDLKFRIKHKTVVITHAPSLRKIKPAEVIPLEVSQPQITVTGNVTDDTGAPLPGVNVVIQGTSIGTITDLSGSFTINIPDENAVLAFSFVGYTPLTISVGNQRQFSIILIPDVKALEEVVVVGYGTQKKESVVGAISQVAGSSLVQSGISNVSNAIAGKLSGVLTIQQTGEPGANNAEIIIRGLSSWNGSNPLVLVDGVERDFNSMDPNEINTISVLKDASATAVFGAKGANGVVIVTTKRGSIGKPKLDFSGSYGIQWATRGRIFVDSYTTMSMWNVALMNDQKFSQMLSQDVLEEYRNPSSPLKAIQYPNVNWWNELVLPFAPTYNANLNISGEQIL